MNFEGLCKTIGVDFFECKKKLESTGIETNRIMYDENNYTYLQTLDDFYAERLSDPRRTVCGNIKYEFHEIITIIAVGMLVGITKIKLIVDFARENIDIFKKFLTLKDGIPSYDTFLRACHRVNINQIQECEKLWVNSLEIRRMYMEKKKKEEDSEKKDVEFRAQDGKYMNGTFCTEQKIKSKVVVTHYSTTTMEVIAELVVDEGDCELTTSIKLLNYINDLRNTITSFDALHCHQKITDTVVALGGDCTLKVKDNQKELKRDIHNFFEYGNIEGTESLDYKNENNFIIRTFYHSNDVQSLPSLSDWPNIKSFGIMNISGLRNGKSVDNNHYYVMTYDNEEFFMESSTRHWSIENHVHRYADMVFKEDSIKLRKDNAPLAANIMIKQTITFYKFVKTVAKKISMERLVNMCRTNLGNIDKFASGLLLKS